MPNLTAFIAFSNTFDFENCWPAIKDRIGIDEFIFCDKEAMLVKEFLKSPQRVFVGGIGPLLLDTGRYGNDIGIIISGLG